MGARQIGRRVAQSRRAEQQAGQPRTDPEQPVSDSSTIRTGAMTRSASAVPELPTGSAMSETARGKQAERPIDEANPTNPQDKEDDPFEDARDEFAAVTTEDAILQLPPEQLKRMLQRQAADLELRQDQAWALHLHRGGLLSREDFIGGNHGGGHAFPHESAGRSRPRQSPEPDRPSKRFKSKQPTVYNGEDSSKLDNFILNCVVYFEAEEVDLEDAEGARGAIRQAATWLEGMPKQEYMRVKADLTTWPKFITFLKGTSKDASTRLIDAMKRMYFDKQGKRQVREYLHDLNQAESEVAAFNLDEEEEKALRFLMGLRVEIRDEVLRDNPDYRKTRELVLEAAVRHETRLDQKQKNKQSQDSPSKAHDPLSSRQKSNASPHSRKSHTNRTGKSGGKGHGSGVKEGGESKNSNAEYVKNVECHNCHQKGHYANACPHPKKSTPKP